MNRLREIMNRLKDLDILLIILAIALVIGGFFLFRVLLIGEGIPPYSKEIAAILLGTLLTILITGIMLHKQTEVELNKERNVKLLEAKMKAYDELLKAIEDILLEDKIDPKQEVTGDKIDPKQKFKHKVIKIQILNQKISFVASMDVLNAFSEFATLFSAAAKDNKIDDKEMERLLASLSELAVQIRIDLASEKEKRDFKEKEEDFRQLIQINTDALSGKMTTNDLFLKSCDPKDRDYFSEVIRYVQTLGLGTNMGVKGFSIQNRIKNKSICWCYPTYSRRGIEISLKDVSSDKQEQAQRLLKMKDIKVDPSYAKRVTFRPSDFPIDSLKDILSLLAE